MDLIKELVFVCVFFPTSAAKSLRCFHLSDRSGKKKPDEKTLMIVFVFLKKDDFLTAAC